jgi:4-amino-4-deoxy-L-arabinose transferase-like glycosyltransferase
VLVCKDPSAISTGQVETIESVWAYYLRSASQSNLSLYHMQVTGIAIEKEIIDERPLAAKRQSYLLASIILVCSITFLIGIGRLALTGPDEPRYAEVAREMYVTGDYISPRLAGCLWFEKPVLVYWMAAVSFRFFGVGEFAARLPSALSAMLAALAIFFGLRRIVSPAWAVSSSLALATFGLFIGFARSITMDMVLASAIAVALIAGFRSTTSDGRSRLAYWAVCWAAVGLACLAKGFVSIILVGLVLGPYLIITGQWKRVGPREIVIAIAATVAVAGVWYVPVVLRNGQEFIDKFIIEHHFLRYLTPVHKHPQPPYFFLFIALAGMMPWTFLIIPALVRIRNLRPRRGIEDSLLTFAWIWLVTPLLFFSFSSSKLPGYILPVFPALAILIGAELERIWRGNRSHAITAGLWLTAALVLTIGIAFVIYLGRQEVSTLWWHTILKWGPVAVGLLAIGALARSRTRQFLLATGGVALLVVTGSVVLLLPHLSQTLSHKTLSLEVASRLTPGEKVAFFQMKEFAPAFYCEGRIVCGVGKGTLLNALHADTLAQVLERETSMIVFTEKDRLIQLEKDRRFAIEMVGEQRKAIAVRLSLKSYGP